MSVDLTSPISEETDNRYLCKMLDEKAGPNSLLVIHNKEQVRVLSKVLATSHLEKSPRIRGPAFYSLVWVGFNSKETQCVIAKQDTFESG